MNTTQTESTILVLVDAITGLLVGTGIITLDVKTTIMSQLPSIVTDAVALIPLAYGIWHGVKFIATAVKNQLKKPSTGSVIVPENTIA